jgi:RNA polymerase sigma-70 factor (ECF subfamily)
VSKDSEDTFLGAPTLGEARARRPLLLSGDDAEDLALVRRCKAGDTHAFQLLVARHQDHVITLMRRILPAGSASDDIDDLVQDVFVQVWRALPRFRADASFATWLYRIATNMAIKHYQRLRRRREFVEDSEDIPEEVRHSLADPNPGPEDAADREARDKALRAAIDRLPVKHRTVVMLHYFEGLECEDVAAITGCSVGTVWSRLYYACRKLRNSLAWLEG